MSETIVQDVRTAEVGPPARPPLRLALALMALALVVGLLVTFDIGRPDERALMKAVAFRESTTGDGLILATQWITWIGDAGQRTVAMVLFAAFLFWRKRTYAALVMLIAPPLAGATSSILKEIFARARPDVVPHLDVVTNLSFPSGHATNVMATYLLAALLIPRTRRPLWVTFALIVALTIGASRVLLGVHWPSDLLGGWCWGAGIALTGLTVARKMEAGA